MALDVVGLRSSSAFTAGTTSVVLPAPAGSVGSDLLVAFVLDHATTGSTAGPTGWTNRGNIAGTAGRLQVFTATVTGAGAGPWTFGSLTTRAGGQVLQFYGVDNTTPMDVTASVRLNASGTTGTTSITTVTAGAVVVGAFGAMASGSTWSAETTATAGAMTEMTDAANSTFLSIATSRLTLAAAGATGASSATMGTAGTNAGILLALRPATVTPSADVSTLTDTFDTADTAKFQYGSVTGVTATGTLNFPVTNTYQNLKSTGTFNLSGVANGTYTQVVQRPNAGAGGTEAMWGLQQAQNFSGGDPDNSFDFNINGTQLQMRAFTASSTASQTSITYDATAHAWLRIRESGGSILWDTSPDGVTWTNRRTRVNDIGVWKMLVRYQVGYFGTETTPGTAIFDNLNLAATSTPMRRVGKRTF